MHAMSTPPDASHRAGHGLPFLGVFLWVVTAALAAWMARPPAPKDADAPATDASAARALEVLQRIARDDSGALSPPRFLGSEANARCRGRILEELRRIGLEPEVQEVFGGYPRQRAVATVRNIVAVLPGARRPSAVPGELPPRDAILCMAHYDSVPAGPGIGDDLAGVAAWLEVARALSADGRLERDVIFLFEDGEEQGLLGAELFAQSHPLAERVGAVVNLEGRGASGPSRMFETGARNRWAIEALASESRAPSATSVSTAIYRKMPNDTDYTVWRERGIPGLNFAFIGGVTAYHTPLDDIETLSKATLQHHCTNGLDAVRALAAAPFPGEPDFEPTGDAVFFDLGGLFLAHMSFSAARLLSVVAMVLAFFSAAVLIRRRGTRPARVFLAVPVLLACVLFAFTVSHAVRLGLGVVGVAPVYHQAHTGPLVLACVAGALAGFSLAAVVAGRLLGPREGLAGALVLLGTLSLGLGFSVTGASHLLVLPTIVASLAVIAAGRSAGARGPVLASFAGLCVAAFLWAPLHLAVVDAFGTMPGPVLSLGIAVPVPVVAAPLLVPFLLFAPCLFGAQGTPFVSLGAFIVAGVVGGLSMQLGSFTPEEPAQVNIVVRTSQGENSRVVLQGLEPCVERFERAFEDAGVPDPDLGRALERPGTVELLERGTREGGRSFVRLRMTPREGCDRVEVYADGIASMSVDGVAATSRPLRILGPSAEGHEIVLEWGRGARPSFRTMETRFGLWHSAVRRAVEPWTVARPDDTVPRGSGDRSEVSMRWPLDAPLAGEKGEPR